MNTEPKITINGKDLNQAQAMAVRVAISSFQTEMAPDGALGEDAAGEAIRQGYSSRISEVLTVMLGETPAGRKAALAAISDAARDMASARWFMERANFRDALKEEALYLMERLQVFRVTAEELTR